MTEIIDISLPLCENTPHWPGSVAFQLLRYQDLNRGDPANVSRICCDAHAGTHIDAPLHFIQNGLAIDQLALDVLIGPCTIWDLADKALITRQDLSFAGLPNFNKRILFRTRNSALRRLEENRFTENYVAISTDAAEYLVDLGVKLIGIDYLSVEPFGNSADTHRTLLSAGVVIVEGLNLANVTPGDYELICLPLKLAGAEGAPARAVLRTFKQQDSP